MLMICVHPKRYLSPCLNLVYSSPICHSSTDTESPSMSSCPETQNVTITDGNATAAVNWTEPRCLDNSGSVHCTSSHKPGDTFPAGSTTVMYTATDEAGNTAECTFNVQVEGNSVTLQSP